MLTAGRRPLLQSAACGSQRHPRLRPDTLRLRPDTPRRLRVLYLRPVMPECAVWFVTANGSGWIGASG